MCAAACHWFVYLAKWIQRIFCHPICYIHPNITLPCTPWSAKMSLSFGFSDDILYALGWWCCLISCACYMPRQPHPSWFDHTNNVWWRSQIKFLLITKCLQCSVLSTVVSTVRFHVLTAASIFWDDGPYGLIETEQLSRGTYRIHHQGDEWLVTLMTEAETASFVPDCRAHHLGRQLPSTSALCSQVPPCSVV
jgi:hypothetical protein